MSGETSKTMPSAASELGPIPGGPWTTIKAKCLPLRTKDTEAGWGVVQFYSEEKEMSSLDEVVEDDLLGKDGAEHADGSTLCIPAVPGHMSPGDFLGFVGDRWIKDLSHCRMVVTGKNNYLVLLKFRDSELARSWQKEFEGQVFNTMEVSCYLFVCCTACHAHCTHCLVAHQMPCRFRQEDFIQNTNTARCTCCILCCIKFLDLIPSPSPKPFRLADLRRLLRNNG